MVLNTLNNDYEFIGIVTVNPDRDDDELRAAHVSERFRKSIPIKLTGCSIRHIINRYIENIVYEPDRRLVYNATKRHAILENLRNNSEYRFGFRVSVDNRIRTVRASFLPLTGNENDSLQYMIALQMVDEGYMDTIENNVAAESLLADYEAIFLVDADNDLIDSLKISKEFHSSYCRFPETKDYSLRIRKSVESNVIYEDREYVMNKLSAAAVLNRLEEHPVVRFDFRTNAADGSRHYYEAVISRRYGPGNRGFILGLRNIDKEVTGRRYNEEITIGLAGDFDSIAYFDIEHDFTERMLKESSKLRELLPELKTANSAEEKSRIFAEKLISPKDREEAISRLEPEVVMKNLRHSSAYFVNFRIIEYGEERYYQAKVTLDVCGGIARGLFMGLHDVNESMMEGFRKEEELAEDKAKAEKEIIRKTAELKERNKALARINDEIVEMLADVVEMRDSGGDEHIIKVKAFTNILAECVKENLTEYGLTDNDVELITSASILHDIGKILIPDAVLLKPGKLTEEEFAIMKNHCNKGCDILMRASRGWGEKYLRLALDICRYHHEKWDGKGYPEGLKGDEIPIAAQIVSVADCYDALTSMRVYDDIHEADDAVDMILRGECGEFSDKLMECLRLCRDKYIDALVNPQKVVEKYLDRNENDEANDLKNIDILLVDDDLLGREINREILEERGARVVEASDGMQALEMMDKMPAVDAVIMDIHMPNMNGIEATLAIRQREANTADRVPVIAITADENMAVMDKMLDAGADGTVRKPLDIGELTRILLAGMKNRSARMGKKLAESIKDANTDTLTKLRNRNAYKNMTDSIAEEIEGKFPPEFAIVACDINNLKVVNDTHGHEMGDVYIRNCSKMICDAFARSPVFRIGGDEFMVILKGYDYDRREELMKNLLERSATAEAYGDILSGKASIAAGMAEFERGRDRTVDDVARRADERMYKNKREHKSRQLSE